MVQYEILYYNIKKYSEIPPEQWEKLVSVLTPRKVEKGEILLKAGEVANEAAFILRGGVRMYYVDEDGNESNHAFRFENQVMAGYPSLLSKLPSRYYIQAIEEGDLLTINYEKFLKFYDEHQCWERLSRVVAELNYLEKTEREYHFLMSDAAQRYMSLVETQPEIIKRVPQYQLASFLGVTASALNRVIKKLKAEGKVE
ncbi:MAG: Crp/Fnr family transcriptional regulator [Oligoflexia bacterium]|nr:Crp/Fnr family transcriptional regulator [Oligoflexia bacterium]